MLTIKTLDTGFIHLGQASEVLGALISHEAELLSNLLDIKILHEHLYKERDGHESYWKDKIVAVVQFRTLTTTFTKPET